MLAESVLADLVQRGPLREPLVAMAWPCLGVAERLQVIQAIQADSVTPSTPGWLLELALADTEPLVRYWAARHAGFPGDTPAAIATVAPDLSRSPTTLVHAQRVKTDSQELVRACLTDITVADARQFTKAPQLARLVALRKTPPSSDSAVVEWLAAAVMARVPGNELRDCVVEFFGRPDVALELQEDDVGDGSEAHTKGETLRKAWALVRVAEVTVGIELARALPLSRGLYTMDMAELLDYPVPILRQLLHRASREPAIAPLVMLLEQQGEALPEDLRNDFTHAHAQGIADLDEEAQELRSRSDRQRAILDAVLALRARIDTLEASVADAAAAVDGKSKR